jgi:hypothetical protein
MFPSCVRPVVVLAALLVSSGGCAPRVPAAGAGNTAAGPVSPGAPTQGPSAQTADVRVAQLSGEVSARVGQSIGVTAPGGAWQVDFDAELLQLLTPVEDLATPGSRGWVWRARKPGRADIVFTSRPRCDQPPCPPSAAQFTLSVTVSPTANLSPPGGPYVP